MRVLKAIRSTCNMTVEITRADLIEAFGLPSSVEIVIRVPGGGDWSNTNLVIGEDGNLSASWTVTTEREEDDAQATDAAT